MFDAVQVAAASRRITRRRRSALAGAALAVLALAGVGMTTGLTTDRGGPATLSSDAPGQTEQGGGAARTAAPEGPQVGPGDFGATESEPPPLGPTSGGCADRQDAALRSLVEQALPEVAGAPPAPTTQECRPGGERGVALQVRDGAHAGLLSVTYLPPGSAVRLAPGAQVAVTASGGTVVVFSSPERAGDVAPYADRIDATVAYLAPRL